MSALWSIDVVSMVVPLQTLPGWEAAPNPPALEVLGLLIGLPLAVVILFSVLGKVSELRASGGEVVTEVNEPLWLGGPHGAARAVTSGQRAALPAQGSPAAGAIDDTSAPLSEQVGGASVRW